MNKEIVRQRNKIFNIKRYHKIFQKIIFVDFNINETQVY